MTAIWRTVFLASAFVSASEALPVVWTVDLRFSDGGTAVGSLVHDDALSQPLLSWHVSVSGGDTALFSPFTFQNGGSQTGWGTPEATYLAISDLSQIGPFGPFTYRGIQMTLAAPLTDAGGVVAVVLGGNSAECYNCTPFRSIVEGSLTSAGAIPEAGSALTGGAGLLLFVTLRRRRC